MANVDSGPVRTTTNVSTMSGLERIATLRKGDLEIGASGDHILKVSNLRKECTNFY